MKISKANPSQPKSAFNKYDEAVKYINSAMSSLTELAKTDSVAKDAIVNLGVVMFDLRHD